MTRAPRELSDLWEIAVSCGTPQRTHKGVRFCCPMHKDKKPSCTAWVSEDGDCILVKCFARCHSADIASLLRDRGFVMRRYSRPRDPNAPVPVPLPKRDPQMDADTLHRQKLAIEIWDNSVSIRGTVAEQYLRSRGLSLDHVSHLHRTLRFHAACPRGTLRQPALIAAYRNVESDALVAVHRIFLKGAAKDGAMMLGPVFAAAIKLTSHEACFDSMHYCPRLHVAEGIETGLAAMGFGFRPLWALGSAGMIANFEPMFGVGMLVVCADNDKAGLSAAKTAVMRWRTDGWQANAEAPPTPGQDYADVAEAAALVPA